MLYRLPSPCQCSLKLRLHIHFLSVSFSFSLIASFLIWYYLKSLNPVLPEKLDDIRLSVNTATSRQHQNRIDYMYHTGKRPNRCLQDGTIHKILPLGGVNERSRTELCRVNKPKIELYKAPLIRKRAKPR